MGFCVDHHVLQPEVSLTRVMLLILVPLGVNLILYLFNRIIVGSLLDSMFYLVIYSWPSNGAG